MLQHYLKTAIRNFLKNRASSLVNIIGLSVGVACCLLIVLFVLDELSYDRHYDRSGRIYRIVKDFVDADGGRIPDATTPPALAPAMLASIPEIEEVVRLFPSWGRAYLVEFEGERYYESEFGLVDSNFFEVFNQTFLEGAPGGALNEKNEIVLTAAMAKKYFGGQPALGRQLTINGSPYQVSAVIADMPENGHFKFDFLGPVSRIGNIDGNWGFYNFYTYARLKEEANIAALEEKVQQVYEENVEGGRNDFYTQPLTDIHLHSHLKWEMRPNGDISYVFIFLSVAFMVLFVAGANYVNLTTARSATRAREVGVRKVSGARREALAGQFLLESVLTVLICCLVAAILVESTLPAFNRLTGKSITLLSPENTGLIMAIFLAAGLVGVLAGLYPAFYLSSFQPSRVLKSFRASGREQGLLRRGLVAFQFVVAIGLIVGVIVAAQQLYYMENKDLGFRKEGLLMLPRAGGHQQAAAWQEALGKLPEVTSVGASSSVLGGLNWTTDITRKGQAQGQGILTGFALTDYNFIETAGIEMLEGRAFAPAHAADTSASIIMNEKAVQLLGMKPPYVGQEVQWSATSDGEPVYRRIVGITRNFHFASLREAVGPFAFILSPQQARNKYLRLETDDYQQTLASISAIWARLEPGRPFDHIFIDDNFGQLHAGDARFLKVVTLFTLFAVGIACLGLFALVSFTIERRVKEIGVRKVLGATVANIVVLLSREYIRLVAFSCLVAIPLAWWAMSRWLSNFAYSVEVPWWAFAVAGLAGLGIALATVSLQSAKAAMANPAEALKYE